MCKKEVDILNDVLKSKKYNRNFIKYLYILKQILNNEKLDNNYTLYSINDDDIKHLRSLNFGFIKNLINDYCYNYNDIVIDSYIKYMQGMFDYNNIFTFYPDLINLKLNTKLILPDKHIHYTFNELKNVEKYFKIKIDIVKNFNLDNYKIPDKTFFIDNGKHLNIKMFNSNKIVDFYGYVKDNKLGNNELTLGFYLTRNADLYGLVVVDKEFFQRCNKYYKKLRKEIFLKHLLGIIEYNNNCYLIIKMNNTRKKFYHVNINKIIFSEYYYLYVFLIISDILSGYIKNNINNFENISIYEKENIKQCEGYYTLPIF